MGVPLEIWRARIGHFACARFKKKSVFRSTADTLTLLMLAAAAVVTIAVLLIGGIEPNPGPFPCNMCSVVPETLASSMRHQHFHASRNKAFMYKCPSQGCERFATTSFGFLKYHVSILHRDTFHQDPSATKEIFCPYSSDEIECRFSTVSLWELVQHLYRHLDAGIKVLCPIDGCERTKDFAKKSTLQVHLSQHHENWRAEGCPKEQYIREYTFNFQESPTIQSRDTDSIPANEEFQTDNNCDVNYVNHELLNDDLVLDSVAKFYLHLYAENLLPQETIQEICESLMFLTEVIQSRIKIILSKELRECDIPQDKVNLICHKVMMADLLYTSHHKSCPGTSLTSDYLRRKYFADNFGFKEPVQINLDENEPDSSHSLQYVSIDQSLTKLLEDDSIEQEIEASFFREPSPENEVRDYYDGSLFKSENHSQKEIHLNIYQDSFNPVLNALGSAKNKYKDLVVYFTISNFRPHLRARIATKYLVLICRESVFKAFGAKKCLSEMMHELKKLEAEGIMFKGERIDVLVEFIIGDNLGQHLIGGFIQSFSCTYFCRFCEITTAEFKSDPSLTKEQRTQESYNRCVLRASLLGKTVKGVKEGCELSSLKLVRATSHLVPCLAHDLFEGVVSWDLAGIIEYFVHKKKWFTYKLLDDRIKNFKCQGIDRSNKPAPIRKDGEKLGGHAVQNWMFLRLFVFLIGDQIQDFHDPGWELYIQLKELCEYFCAPTFLKSEVPYLKDVLIPAYFDKRKEVLSEIDYHLKPKHHFMAHYPELMLLYGPLIHLWTLPFEQKHSFFKELMRKTRNFINPEHSCAVRYQMSFCYTTTSELFSDQFVERKTKVLSSNSFTGGLSVYLSGQNLEDWFDSEGVSVGSTKYTKGDILLLASRSYSLLEIGVIKVIATKDNSLNFVIEEHKAIYDKDLGLYEIQLDSSGTFSTQEYSTLKYPVPQPLYIWRGRSLLSLKFRLVQCDNGDDDL